MISPVTNSEGAAVRRSTYDERNYLRAKSFFGVGGRPTLERSQLAAGWTLTYDDLGRETETALIGLQLGHSGPKGSTRVGWEGTDEPLPDGNWPLLAASDVAYGEQNQIPRAMTRADMDAVRDAFVATRGARQLERAFGLARDGTAKVQRGADVPMERRAALVGDAVHAHAVVAVDAHARAGRIGRLDIDVMTGDALVRPVDHERARARATYGQRPFRGQRQRALAGRHAQRDRELGDYRRWRHDRRDRSRRRRACREPSSTALRYSRSASSCRPTR